MRGFSALISFLAVGAVALAAPQCPSDKNEWRDWNRARVKLLFQGAFREFVVNPVVDKMEACRAELKAAPEVLACLDPLRRFTKARWWDFQAGHTLGVAIPDTDYMNRVPYPDFLELPIELKDPDFLRWVEDEAETANLEKALAYIERVNAGIADPGKKWLTFIYRSQHLGTPDGTGALGRFFVYVPGKDFDRYFQFGLRDDASNELPKGFSVVSVQKTDPTTGKPLPAALARAKDFWRVRKNGEIQLSTRLKVKGGLENCYQCHKSALLPITPDPAVFDEKRFGKTVKLVNRLMAGYPDLKLFGIDPADYGPGIGPLDSATRTPGFMMACAAGKVSDPKRLEAIRAAMNCQSCHDGSKRGLLNYPSGMLAQPASRKSLVHQYIVDHGRMPPGQTHLTRDERMALAECLRKELYETSDSAPGLLKTWLLSEACWNAIP